MKKVPPTLLLLLSFALVAHLPAQEAGSKEAFGQPVAFWLDRLRSKDLLERDEAIQVFAKIGPAGREAVPLLKAMLKDADADARFRAAVALWNVQDDGMDSVVSLREDFAQMTPARKQELFHYALTRKKPDDALFALFDVLRREPQFENRIAFHIPTLGKAAIPHFAKWIATRQGKDRVVAIQTTPSVFLISDRGTLLVKYLKDPDPFCRVAAAAALAPLPETRDAALAVLVELAEAKDEAVVDAVLRALVNQSLTYRKAAAIYPLGLKHASLNVRLGVARPVFLLHPNRLDDVIAILAEAVRDTSPQIRYPAFSLITELGPKGEKLVPVLMGLLKDSVGRGDGIAILGALRPHAERVGKEIGELVFADARRGERFLTPGLRPFVPHFADAIRKHLEGDDPARKLLAMKVARDLPPATGKTLVPLLTPLLKKPETAGLALETLRAYGKEARGAAGDVLALIDGPDAARLIPTIKQTLLAIEPEPKILDPVLDRFKAKANPTADERLLAAELALLHPKRRGEAADFLGPVLDGKERVNSFALGQVLDRLGPEDARLVPGLRAYLKRIPGAILTLDKVFLRMGPAAKEVVPDLLEEIKTQRDYSNVLRSALVIYTLDPEKRGPADERIAELFLDRLERLPLGNELNYHFRQVVDLCRTGPGPTKALTPLLLKIFRGYPQPELQADLAGPLVRLDPAVTAEVVKTFEQNLGEYPTNSEWALIGLLRVRPDHPRALAAMKQYLQGSASHYPAVGARIAMACDRPLPGVRELLEAQLKVTGTPDFKEPAYIAMMREDGKLNPVWIDEIFQTAQSQPTPMGLLNLRHLGPLAATLVPRILDLPGDERLQYYHRELADILRRTR